MRFTKVGGILVTALILSVGPAAAQIEKGQNEAGVYVGGILGDDLTNSSPGGAAMTPELDDDVVFGVRWGYNFNQRWGLDVSAGYIPGTAQSVPPGMGISASGEVDIDVFLFDVDGVFYFNPDSRAAIYVLAGIGFASGDLDAPLPLGGMLVQDDSGITANAGVGAKFFITDHFLIRVEARYRFIDSLVDQFDDSLNTGEGTVGASWVF
ncbi:MAG: porin family protein [Acidobacteriota bacterium]